MNSNLKKIIEDKQISRYYSRISSLSCPEWAYGIEEVGYPGEIYLKELTSMVYPYCWRGLCFSYLSINNKDKHNFFSILLETLIEPIESYSFSYENKDEIFNISHACLTEILAAKLSSYIKIEEDLEVKQHLQTIKDNFGDYHKKKHQLNCFISDIEFSEIKNFNYKDIAIFDYLKYISTQEINLNKIENWYENFEKLHQMKLRKEVIRIFQNTKKALYHCYMIDLLTVIYLEKKINTNFSEKLMNSIFEALTTLGKLLFIREHHKKQLAILDNAVEKMSNSAQNPIISKVVNVFVRLRKSIDEIGDETPM